MNLSNEQIAKKALEWARSWILKGSTQLENNMLEVSRFDALVQAVKDVRALLLNRIEITDPLKQFEVCIANCKKYSIGNCWECALMALDYMLTNHPNISAEVYGITGGDHAFLVIGRHLKSHTTAPMTWGDDAYICDPWSNCIYPTFRTIV